MPIHYALRKLHTITDSDVFCARVQRLDAVEMKNLVDHIVARGSTVGRADILSVLDDYHSTIRDLLLLGMSINTPTVCYRPGIEGTFSNLNDSFDPSRHRLTIRLRAGALLRTAVRTGAELVKELADPVRPVLVQCDDLTTGTANQFLTPGEAIFLTGKRLRFDKADPEAGVFFTAEDGTVTRAERVIEIRPGRITLLVPALAAGVYQVELKARFSTSGELRGGTLEKLLTVL